MSRILSFFVIASSLPSGNQTGDESHFRSRYVGLKDSAPLAGIWMMNSGSPIIHDKANVSESRAPKTCRSTEVPCTSVTVQLVVWPPIHVSRAARRSAAQRSDSVERVVAVRTNLVAVAPTL